MDKSKLNKILENEDIITSEFISNTKASEEYIDTVFIQEDGFEWQGYVPYQYRRTGLHIETEEELAKYLISIKPYFVKEEMKKWIEVQKKFWKTEKYRAKVTFDFFEAMCTLKWTKEFSQNNNPQRRIQDIKELGYTISTRLTDKITEILLLPIPREEKTGYETFSLQFKKRIIKTFGSLCSGIEAATLVLKPMGFIPLWYSEIAEFPSIFLKKKYPEIPNLGDMNYLPKLLKTKKIEAPDLLCGGTPCQAFSLAGIQNGLNDNRGQLTLKYIEIADEIDNARKKQGKDNVILLWENVEGVLTDKTNVFGNFLAGLGGLAEPIEIAKFPPAGILHGRKRNIAWRVLDGKYFGLPQQRKRLYLIAGGKTFFPERVLLEIGNKFSDPLKKAAENIPSLFDNEEPRTDKQILSKIINGNKIEVFRSYTDCLYAAYGTKWNGNAAAYNGSLFVAQNKKLRRLTPLECERLMGFPDNYTLIQGSCHTNRYKAIGNSWAIPVVKWIAGRIMNYHKSEISLSNILVKKAEYELALLENFVSIGNFNFINASSIPYDYKIANLIDYVDINASEDFYISQKGCSGILRRKNEKNIRINQQLEKILVNVAS